ncbi:hypothetical protein CAXC1_220037 [Candidatus Xenohaliotis californiensis]|uniref:Uncharacterized protein n=1 Tax=Candidatus Xenohaliotis californiensis TaxID=84677 RepID=A0ABP0ETS5_9RICK|nr:hypothetical protein CAXC1_220037 [Candidatus Xenohaliotis californiensis]
MLCGSEILLQFFIINTSIAMYLHMCGHGGMVDALGLGSSGVTCGGSSPPVHIS